MAIKRLGVDASETIARDALKSITLADLDRILGLQRTGGDVREAYRFVAWLFRAVQLRAGAVSTLPWDLKDAAGNVVPSPAWIDVGMALWQAEAALCIWGAAYFFIRRRGLRVLGLDWLLPQSISWERKPDGTLAFKRRKPDGTMVEVAQRDIVYIWPPDPLVEIGPATSPFMVVAAEAEAARALNDFLRRYFERGGVPVTLLTVTGPAPEAELDRLRTWWEQLLSGARNAFRTVAVRADVKPLAVGAGPAELALPELWGSLRDRLCVAMGIPQTMMHDAANYATAREHRASFYRDTVVPEAQLITSAFNQQLFARLGLRLEIHPERLELFREASLQSAEALGPLVMAGVLSAEDARRLLGMEASGAPAIVTEETNE